MHVYPLGWFTPPSKSFSIFSGQNHSSKTSSHHTGAPDFDEIVHVSGRQVVWSSSNGSSQCIYKSYCQDLNAKQALLCSFSGIGIGDRVGSLGVTGDSQVGDQAVEEDNDERSKDTGDNRCLCVLQGLMECVKIYAPDGAEFEVALPCKAARMWALPRGILIERAEKERPRQANGAPLLSPVYFSLLHPLEELKPVSYITGNESSTLLSSINVLQSGTNEELLGINVSDAESQTGSDGDNDLVGEFMCDSQERILFVDSELCLVVTYHRVTCKHSVWSLLPAAAIDAVVRTPRSQTEMGYTHDEAWNGQDDDDLIESEVFMKQVWCESGKAQGCASCVFVAHDYEGRPLICMMHTETNSLKALLVKTHVHTAPTPIPQTPSFLVTPLPSLVRSVPRMQIFLEVAFEMKVRSAQPIVTTKSASLKDIIVLTMENKLALYSGNIFLSTLELSTVGSPLEAKFEDNILMDLQDQQIVKLAYAVSNRVNLVLSNTKSLRVCTCMTFHSPLVRPCIDGIESALPARVSLAFTCDVAKWVDELRNTSNTQLTRLTNRLVCDEGILETGKSLDIEWAAFVIVVTLLLSKETRRENQRQSSSQSEDTRSVYEKMISTDFHREFMESNAKTMSILRSSVSRSVVKDNSNWYDELEGVRHLVSLTSNAQELIKNGGVLIYALHLVYEEMKLSTLTWSLTRPLVSFLYGLVESLSPSSFAYLDHYRRDFGRVSPVSLPSVKQSDLKLPSDHPPDVYSWLGSRIVSEEPVDHASWSEASFSRPFPELETCHTTQRLCCFFDLLSGKSGDNATLGPLEFRVNKTNGALARGTPRTPAMSTLVAMDSSFDYWMSSHGYEAADRNERTVLGMVWFGFTLADIETLPFGLSVPLREALYACRGKPGVCWPADAYVLIGREDMAAFVLAPPQPVFNAYLGDNEAEIGLQLKSPSGFPLSSLVSPSSSFQSPVGSSHKRGVRQLGRKSEEFEMAPHAHTNMIITAVTPIWRRLPSMRCETNFQLADDILWSGEAVTKSNQEENSHMLHRQQTGSRLLTETTSHLLSIADFARLSISASAEVDILEAAEVKDQSNPNTTPSQESDPAGFDLLMRMTALRFGRDRRIREVCRLLRSSSSVRLTVDRGPETSDYELQQAQQAKLLLISYRTMGLPVGRGMITLGTVRPLLTDAVVIPPLVLAGRIPPNNAIIQLDLATVAGNDLLLRWPEFHNGVAAGLRLAAGKDVTPLTRTWIAYNRPETPNFTHAGFLLALGLQGHLAALTMADIYEYLAQGHDATTVAIMLGLSVAKRRTMSPTISKMLCLHIPSLLPPAFVDMDIPSDVQIAALMGVGLLYLGTGHRLMTEFLLAEIGKRPQPDRYLDRESYSLTAGLSLGLITLGQGARSGGLSGLMDLHLEDRLHRYMVGGIDAIHGHGADINKCSRLKEGAYVNISVTAPGATLALAFTYMKSGNESVAARLAIPDTHFLLDYVRPDFLMLRVIGRGLVLWDSVEATDAWLQSQIPSAIRLSYENLCGDMDFGPPTPPATADGEDSNIAGPENDEHEYELVDGERRRPGSVSGLPAELDITTPAPRNTRTRLKRRNRSMESAASRASSVGEGSAGHRRRQGGAPVDERSILQAHANIVAGACFAIGLRYVGTASMSARNLLMKYVNHFVAMRQSQGSGLNHNTIETCLATSAIALAFVMAGTGDLVTLKLLRSLRFKTDRTVCYGSHMTIGSAVGLLFLGAGKRSLGNDNASLAALVCAFFPRFPYSTGDNQYHLQALRHLYVIATEERCIETYDIDSRSPCYLPIKVSIRADAMSLYADRVNSNILDHQKSDPTVVEMVAPCLLPPLAWISSIESASPRYWHISLQLDGAKFIMQRNTLWTYRVLCVKRKVGHLSYSEDPQGVSSLLARPKTKLFKKQMLAKLGDSDVMRSYTADPYVLAFSMYFCTQIKGHSTRDDAFVEFAMGALYECLTFEKPEMLSVMMDLYHCAYALDDSNSTLYLRNVKLLELFYNSNRCNKAPLIQKSLLESLHTSLKEQLEPIDRDPSLLDSYLRTLKFPTPEAIALAYGPNHSKTDLELERRFANLLVLYSIPQTSMLQCMKDDFKYFVIANLPSLVQKYRSILPLSLLKMVQSLEK